MQTETAFDNELAGLSEGDRRLLDMARIHRSDAALGAQLGLPTGEVQRRLDLLANKLGYSGRMALRDGREPLVQDHSSDEIDFTQMMPAAAYERPSVLPGLVFAVTSVVVAIGLVAWLVTQ